jgi:hypothetical protein
MKKLKLTSIILLATIFAYAQSVSDFENLSLSPNSYWDGASNPSGTTFTSGDATFKNYYEAAYGGYWDGGFAYTNIQDSTTSGYTNTYAAKALTGYNGSSNYAIGKNGAIIHLTGIALGKRPRATYITNSTYAYNSMRDGDSFAKKFGGTSGNDADYLKLTIKKWLGGSTGNDSVEFYLADFRFTDNSKDYIIKDWTVVDLSALGDADSLIFSLSSSDMSPYGMNTPGYFCLDDFNSADVFAPIVGQIGSTAIYKDSSSFVAWATAAAITRGLQDISNSSLGYATVGDHTMALGKAGSNGVVSLGDGGSAILTFDKPIIDKEGYDFAVFENAFNDSFLELAFIEVSSDGTRFVRFPSVSYTQDTTQVTDSIGAENITNLAGKYRNGYGTPFDLAELADSIGLDINKITHIKIIDVIGSIQNVYATYDSKGNKINEPWSTPFASSGFDLDAVGVIHQEAETNPITNITTNNADAFFSNVFPNPLQNSDELHFNLKNAIHVKATVTDMYGKAIIVSDTDMQQGLNSIPLSDFTFTNGAYFLQLIAQDNVYSQKIIVQND